MAAKRLDFSDHVPANATQVFLLFEIEPPTARIAAYGFACGEFPTVLRDKGRVAVKLLTQQSLLIETSADVTKSDITVSGYTIDGDFPSTAPISCAGALALQAQRNNDHQNNRP